ncbi:uncharacterized protein LOC126552646 [Aphis gossypii]|uniref:uncharacterized protein LOC126552646 n=1 Tax=Aphis gossypii TaxID=80765 RepID=UPI0021592761|nr:uncharacterized protein LOC126552646 [Aphis gossypii]
MPVHDRREALRKNRLCYACLSDQDMVSQCAVTKPCSRCDDKHHSLVHRNNASESNATIDNIAPIDPTVTVSSMTSSVIHRNVMLGTALVHIRNHSGSVHTVRALIDGGSQISVLTTRCVDRLGLKLKRWTAAVTGLAGVEVPSVVGQVKCVMTPRYADTPQIPISAWVLNNITSSMPTRPMPSDVKDRYSNLAMADPSFDQPGPIDLLIGADLYPLVMESGKVVVGEDLPAAFSTIFGWIIVGLVPKSPMGEPHCGLVSLSVSLEETLNKFWQVEEPDAAPREFTEYGQCEQIFCNQMSRLDDGRFSVPLPFRVPVSPDTFEGSRQLALKHFIHLERKLQSNPALYDSYRLFMHEYLSLGHMSIATSPGIYYIPHHAVLKDPSDLSKVRVVFDASATGFSGRSLNSCLHVGAKLQQDIIDILLLFRTYHYVFTTDVCKMYKQILINPEFRPYQHIFWRSSPTEQLIEYELNTVTYGVTCAPFLTLRVLQFIAENDCEGAPAVREALLRQTYIDDVFMGADTMEELISYQSQLLDISLRAGFRLKKWLSNSDQVLNNIPLSDRVHKIRQLVPQCIWGHVRTHDNPADCASRGLPPSSLVNMKLYWHGPAFLTQAPSTWCPEIPPFEGGIILEIKSVSLTVYTPPLEIEWIERFSSYDQMLNVVAWDRHPEVRESQQQKWATTITTTRGSTTTMMVSGLSMPWWCRPSRCRVKAKNVTP